MINSAGILAAGLGSRLQNLSSVPKVLFPIHHKPLIAWTVDQLIDVGIENIYLILNQQIAKSVQSFLKQTYPNLHFTFWIQDTQSSYESFHILSHMMPHEDCLITTVDSIYPKGQLNKLIEFASLKKDTMVLGVTHTIDDEKPLFITMDDQNLIQNIGQSSLMVTCGVYYFCQSTIKNEIHQFNSLRQYLKYYHSLHPVYGYFIDPCYDIDRPEDIQAILKDVDFISSF